MPQHRSCKKRMRTSSEQRARNRALRSQMSKAIIDFRESSKRTDARTQLNQVMGLIDQAARQHIVHKNKAARDKSRLMTFFNRLPE